MYDAYQLVSHSLTKMLLSQATISLVPRTRQYQIITCYYCHRPVTDPGYRLENTNVHVSSTPSY